MDAEAWGKVRESLANLLEMSPADRDEELERLAAADPETAVEVIELLMEGEGDRFAATALQWKGIGGYELIREIGRGGSSIVFAARKEGLDRTVALKLILRKPEGLDGNDEYRREQKALSKLRHPGIVGLLDGGRTEGGLPFLVLELIEGTPVDLFCRDRCQTLHEIVELFIRLCDAVAAAHECGIIHRDIKPANVLVEAGGAPRLLDFGVAKVFSPGMSTRPVAMTLAFASPEQVRAGPVMAASDVYALGALGHLLLTGESPYHPVDGSDLLALSQAICEGEWSPPKSYRIAGTAYPADRQLNSILERCLEKDPAGRYSSAGPLVDDLRRWQRGQAVEGDRRGAFWRDLVRYRVVALVTAVFFSAVFLLVASIVWRVEEAERMAAAERTAAQYRVEAMKLIQSNLSEAQEASERAEPLAPERRRILGDSLASLHKLRSMGEDARLLYDLGIAYSMMSRLPGEREREREEALRDTLKAQELFLRLHEASPAEVTYSIALSRNYLWMAELFEARGDRKAAFSAYREAGSYVREMTQTEAHKRLLRSIARREAAGHLELAKLHGRVRPQDQLESADVLSLLAEAEFGSNLVDDALRSYEAAAQTFRAADPTGAAELGPLKGNDLGQSIARLREVLGRRLERRAGWK